MCLLFFLLLLPLLQPPMVAGMAAASDCTSLAAEACAIAANSSMVFISAPGGNFGVALCNQSAALACSLAPASAFIMSTNMSAEPTLVAVPYSSVDSARGVGMAQLMTDDGSILNITDTWGVANGDMAAIFSSAALVQITRGATVVAATPRVTGFCLRISLSLCFSSTALEAQQWFVPGLLYGSGEYTPPWAIGGGNRDSGVVFREDRAAAPLAMLVDAARGTVAGVIRSADAPSDTVLNDTLSGAPVVDNRMTFASLGFERGDNGQGALVCTFPGSEYPRTYMSGSPTGSLWRFHAFAPASPPSRFSATFSFRSLPPATPQFFHAAVDWVWQGAFAYFKPLLRTDIVISDAHEALVASLADTFSPAAPIPGVPTGFDKITGVPYSSVLELGFVGPQLRMAVSLLQNGLAGGIASANATRVHMATAMLDAWVAATGPGFTHAVWNMDTGTSGNWIDDGRPGLVYLRRAVVSRHHALEAAKLVRNGPGGCLLSPPSAICGQAGAWQDWALSLADVLVAVQAPNGSFARQYSVASPPALPTPTDYSTTATALPLRFLMTAYNVTGNTLYLKAGLAAGEYAWAQFGQRDLYVGAAIDNPDVVDKESSLFALDGFLALYDATMNATWLDRAASASLISSTWMRVTNIPNPVDSPHMDWDSDDTTAGLGLIALGHSGSDTFDSMFILPRLRLCALTGDVLHAQTARLALLNSKQPLDLSGKKGYAQRGFQSELFAFSVGFDIFSGHNDGRGIGDPHFVPWTSANGAYGVAQFCLEPAWVASLPAECAVGLAMPVC